MAVFVAGMLVLILLAVILVGRQCCALRKGLAEVRGELGALCLGVRSAAVQLKKLAEDVRETSGRTETLISSEAGTLQSLGGLWRESERQTEALRALLAREDAAEVLGRLEKAMREGPTLSADEEARVSREVQEGIENLMRYSLATARGKGGGDA